MANADPTTAEQMASQLTDASAQSSAYQSIMNTLARQDPSQAATLLNSLQNTASYDSAAVSYTRSIARNDSAVSSRSITLRGTGSGLNARHE